MNLLSMMNKRVCTALVNSEQQICCFVGGACKEIWHTHHLWRTNVSATQLVIAYSISMYYIEAAVNRSRGTCNRIKRDRVFKEIWYTYILWQRNESAKKLVIAYSISIYYIDAAVIPPIYHTLEMGIQKQRCNQITLTFASTPLNPWLDRRANNFTAVENFILFLILFLPTSKNWAASYEIR